jgi:hypothetical protein
MRDQLVVRNAHQIPYRLQKIIASAPVSHSNVERVTGNVKRSRP